MNFRTENQNNNVIFTVLEKSVENKIAAELKANILIVAQPDISSLILDMSHIAVIDSSGLGALLLAHRQLKDHKIPIVLVGLNHFIKNLLNITRIGDIFLYAKSVEEAVSIVTRLV